MPRVNQQARRCTTLPALYFFLIFASGCLNITHATNSGTTKLLPQCAPCTTDVHCASRNCVHNRCVFKTPSSFAHCFSHPILPECAPCFSPGQCKQGVCWGRKCTDGTPSSLSRCFLPPCSKCTSSLQCSTKLCFAGRCAVPAPAHGRPPTPCPESNADTPTPPGLGRDGAQTDEKKPSTYTGTSKEEKRKKPTCEPCANSAECDTGACRSGLCLRTKSPQELFLCRRLECRTCVSHASCRSDFCLAGKCVFPRNPSSRGRCFPARTFRPRCASCNSSLDCSVGVCDSGRCTDGTARGRKNCLTATCGSCEKDSECRDGRCWRGRCIKYWRRRHRCLDTRPQHGTECAKCVRDRHCKAGACVSGRCATVPEEAKKRCFRDECAKCNTKTQCKHGAKCRKGRCTGGGAKGRALCGGGGKLAECQKCDDDEQCKSKLCWSSKCVFRSFHSMDRCFGDASMLKKMK